jgi:hypothetical protein
MAELVHNALEKFKSAKDIKSPPYRKETMGI